MTSKLFRRSVVTLTFLACLEAGYAVTGNVLSAEAQAGTATAQAPTRVFSADVDMILNTIKPGKTGEFEMVIGKLKEALGKSENPQRRSLAGAVTLVATATGEASAWLEGN